MKDTVIEIPREFADGLPTLYTLERGGFATHLYQGVRLASTPQDYLRFAHMRLNGGELDWRAHPRTQDRFVGLLLQPSATNGLRGPHGLYIIDTIILRLRVSRRVFSKHDMNLSLARRPGAPSGHGAMPFSDRAIHFLGFDWCFVCGSL